ncbi:DNA repair protein RadC [Parashewanella spongiae]|uniref:DNA repair protein RadC n=1 Tax=Parashewanella spongiae TaxID=342950 RepID=A0A3A6UI50_9GAMM|nr:DNA repair protein RadC [Parashewanella spongiae]MCL1077048.1 DNA repair protein RadC [Parashewanella spongiae]RJY18738.1 DNA repair protein RadC [Parashewanella spongiae]
MSDVEPPQSSLLALNGYELLEKAAQFLAQQFSDKDVYANPDTTKAFLSCKLAHLEREVFAIMLLNNQHQLIQYQELFLGSIDGAQVHPREVVKVALKYNAAAVIVAHNHPSGVAEPSEADKHLTQRLVDALSLIDVRVLDPIVIGKEPVSFAERGYLNTGGAYEA